MFFNITPEAEGGMIEVTGVTGTPEDFTVFGLAADRDEDDMSTYERRFRAGAENGHAYALLVWFNDPRAEQDGIECICGGKCHDVTVDTNEAYGDCETCGETVTAYGYAFGRGAK